jgi:glycosyltransferase involved in cell wall biosynthesis
MNLSSPEKRSDNCDSDKTVAQGCIDKDHEMRVGIDAHCLGQKKTGNETYTYSLVKHLSLLEQDGIDYIVYLSDRGEEQSHSFSNTFVSSKLLRPNNPLIRIPIGFAIESRVDKLDVLHAQYLLPLHLRCRTVLSVFDILYERYPEFFTKSHYYRHKIGVRWSCQKADHVITISESSKRDLVELYGLDPERITVTYLGPDECYRLLDQTQAKRQLKENYGIEEDFILYVGAIQPRKNIPRLLSAFAQMKSERHSKHKLVIVGPRAWLSQDAFRALEDSPVRKDVILTGYVPRGDLPYFYNAAAVFVFVSMCEGFGLPVVEAMACGTPTITSRGSSLEEIAGEAAILIDPRDSGSIAAAMGKVLSDSDLRARLRSLGLARSKEFSCEKMASQTQAIYRRLSSCGRN